MAAQASIVINDGETTPVTRTFAPRGIARDGVAIWNDVTYSTVVAGYAEITQLLRRPVQPAADVFKLVMRMRLPLLETVSSTGTSQGYTAAPRVAYVMQATTELLLPVRSTTQDRTNLDTLMKNLLGQGVFTNASRNLDPAY